METNNECSICMEELKKDTLNKEVTSNITTICNHTYHEKCIVKWVKQNKNSCPICRVNIVKPNTSNTLYNNVNKPDWFVYPHVMTVHLMNDYHQIFAELNSYLQSSNNSDDTIIETIMKISDKNG